MVKLLRIPEVSRLTGLSENTLRYWRQENLGPKSVRMGRRIVYRESDILDWINEQFDEAE